MPQFPSAPFLRDPITVPRKELIDHYRAQSARYKQLAERQHLSSVYEGLLGLARQCAAIADALASPKGDQSAKPELSEAEILLLLNRAITEEKSVSTATANRPQSPSVVAVFRELSLDEILQKIQRDIAEEGDRLRVDLRSAAR
jgi:hypothetical protein